MADGSTVLGAIWNAIFGGNAHVQRGANMDRMKFKVLSILTATAAAATAVKAALPADGPWDEATLVLAVCAGVTAAIHVFQNE